MTIRQPRRRPLRGFTLLEVLVALALSLLLIAAVYTGLDLYWRFSSAGQDEIERAQIARALLRQIELDLRSTVYFAQSSSSSQGSGTSSTSSGSSGSGQSSSGTSPSSSSGGSGTSGNNSNSSNSSSTNSSGSTDTSTAQTTSPDAAATTSTCGLYGDMYTLMMHVSKPALELAPGTTPRTSDQVAVAYFLAGKGSGALSSAASGSGLARLQGERMAMSQAGQQSNGSALAANTRILAAEVTALQFMYFDGLAWRYDWDSSVLAGLPRAVAISVQVTGRRGDVGTYNLTVFLPVSIPPSTTTSTTTY